MTGPAITDHAFIRQGPTNACVCGAPESQHAYGVEGQPSLTDLAIDRRFVDGRPRIVDDGFLNMNWSGRGRDGFRCYLCGEPFQIGDQFRFQSGAPGTPNALICGTCDGPDVVERWTAWVQDVRKRAWWAFPARMGGMSS